MEASAIGCGICSADYRYQQRRRRFANEMNLIILENLTGRHRIWAVLFGVEIPSRDQV